MFQGLSCDTEGMSRGEYYTICCDGGRVAHECAITGLMQVCLQPVQSSGPAGLKAWSLGSRTIDATLRDRLIDQEHHMRARERAIQPYHRFGGHHCLRESESLDTRDKKLMHGRSTHGSRARAGWAITSHRHTARRDGSRISA